MSRQPRPDVPVWELERWSLGELAVMLRHEPGWCDSRPQWWDDEYWHCQVVDCGDNLIVPIRDDPTLRGKHVNRYEYEIAKQRRLGAVLSAPPADLSEATR